MSRVQVSVNPEVLKWARESINKSIEDVATGLQTSSERISAFEDGSARPTFSQLISLAKIYKRTTATLMLPTIPPDAKAPRAFRTVYGMETDEFSSDTLTAIRRARWAQEKGAEFSSSAITYPFRRITLRANLENATQELRELLGITVKDQFGWDNVSSALTNWKSAVEGLGIYVLQHRMDMHEARGFSLVDKKPYVIMLNSADADVGRIFSLFHEMAHVMLNLSGICNYDELPRSSRLSAGIERFCNAFSGMFLVPADALLEHDIAKILLALDETKWSDDQLRTIGNKFKVSKDVILRRFLELGHVSPAFYKSKQVQWEKEREELRKIEEAKEKKPVIIPYDIKVVARNGRAYSNLVFDQYYSHRLTLTEASSFLGIAPKHFDSVEKRLGR